MATNDFIYDLVDKLAEEKIEYLLVAIQKGKQDHKATAYFNITTGDGADMMITTIDEVFKRLTDDDDEMPDEIEIDRDDFREDTD